MIRTTGKRLTCGAAVLFCVAAGSLAFADPTGRLRAFADQFPICVGAPSSNTDEGAFLAASAASMTTMMKDMTVGPVGDVDRDFVSMMVPHHQGAIDMAQAVLRYGRNERLRRMAQEIIVTQQQEIVAMRMVSDQTPPAVVPAPDRFVSAEPNNPTSPQQADPAKEP